ncbi:hypothetical protein [Chryseobacterium sp. 7]|uniref:hypothetical protein n=1 Tax=Chryseobacterium sp. 7 TaxID=2035214 RepID=UPI0011C42A2B|nr:hypothetical protein [Chryseobacterium sp. 7]
MKLKNLISCKPAQFQNGAKVFWEYDCNTSWITFQNRNIKRKIFELEKDFIELSGRLGYRNWTEYKKSFLIENSIVSGCCQPGEYILYDKNNGRKIADLGSIIFISKYKNIPYTITLKTNSKLLYTNLNSSKSYPINIPKDKIEKTLKSAHEFYPENLFENIKIKNNILYIQLRYKVSKKAHWKIENITMNVKNANHY